MPWRGAPWVLRCGPGAPGDRARDVPGGSCGKRCAWLTSTGGLGLHHGPPWPKENSTEEYWNRRIGKGGRQSKSIQVFASSYQYSSMYLNSIMVLMGTKG